MVVEIQNQHLVLANDKKQICPLIVQRCIKWLYCPGQGNECIEFKAM